jgi:LuxR family maltose regulon positive regulatory protein
MGGEIETYQIFLSEEVTNINVCSVGLQRVKWHHPSRVIERVIKLRRSGVNGIINRIQRLDLLYLYLFELTMSYLAQPSPLLATKFHIPRARARAVARPRLLSRFLLGMELRLCLLAAPAGFGKSTLLAQALANLPAESELAYLALEANDNDPSRFWSYVLHAIERSRNGSAQHALQLLQASPNNIELALTELLNRLAEQRNELILVLDDFHTISHVQISKQLDFLISHAPPQLHLVIASRSDPMLSLGRLRARGELLELRAADLRFTSEESLAFFNQSMGLQLDLATIEQLEKRTEGWAAGLQLAALSLQGQSDQKGFVEQFSGSHRHVVDYLAGEVLEGQSEQIRCFLLYTAVLERMHPELCEALLVDSPLAGQSALAILEELERQNLFLIPLDDQRQWYRYHHLFGELLRHRLKRELGEKTFELHRKAAVWYEAHGAINDAIEHALASKDLGLLGQMLGRHAERFLANGQIITLQRWLDALPREQLLGDLELSLVMARLLLFKRELPELSIFLANVERLLESYHGSDSASLRGKWYALHAHAEIERGNFQLALARSEQALAILPQEELWARSDCGLIQGYALMMLGRTEDAIAVHRENIRHARAAGNPVSGLFSATEVVKLTLLQGKLGQAWRSAEESLAWAVQEGWDRLPPASAIQIWLGNTLFEQGDFEAAEDTLRRAIALSNREPGITSARSLVFFARVQIQLNKSERANSAISEIESMIKGWQPAGERSFFEAWIARLRIQQGDLAAAQAWATSRPAWQKDEPYSYFREIELLSLARLAFAQAQSKQRDDQLASTREMLDWLLQQAQTGQRHAVVFDCLVLLALIDQQSRDPQQAQIFLEQALALTEAEGWLGNWLEWGKAIRDLLCLYLAHPNQRMSSYAAHILAGFTSAGPAVAQIEAAPAAIVQADALSEREREVLRLYAKGMSSSAIAAHFVVSVNTVKTQLKSIYNKLDCHSRAEAIARARELGIFSHS